MQRDIIYAYLDEEESAKNIETHVFSGTQIVNLSIVGIT